MLLQGSGAVSIPPLEVAVPSEQDRSTGASLKADFAMQESLVSLPTGRGEGMRSWDRDISS